MTALSPDAEDSVAGVLHVGLIDADHLDQSPGRSRPGDCPLERAGVGHIDCDLFVAGATVAGEQNFYIAGDARGGPPNGLNAADPPHFTAIRCDDGDGRGRR